MWKVYPCHVYIFNCNTEHVTDNHDDVIRWKHFRVTGPLCGEFTGHRWIPSQRPVTRSFDVSCDLCLNKRLSKQSWSWWFVTPSRSLWYQCHVSIKTIEYVKHCVILDNLISTPHSFRFVILERTKTTCWCFHSHFTRCVRSAIFQRPFRNPGKYGAREYIFLGISSAVYLSGIEVIAKLPSWVVILIFVTTRTLIFNRTLIFVHEKISKQLTNEMITRLCFYQTGSA